MSGNRSAKKKHYVLTETAARDFRQAKQWSLSRWGKELTQQYFVTIHQTAEKLAQNKSSLSTFSHLISEQHSNLKIYPVKEHYLVYMSLSEGRIAIVSLIRQTRDVPAIIEANGFAIRREVKEIYKRLNLGSVDLCR